MNPLHDFYMGALGAEIEHGEGEFSARMATYYCRWLMALEACA